MLRHFLEWPLATERPSIVLLNDAPRDSVTVTVMLGARKFGGSLSVWYRDENLTYPYPLLQHLGAILEMDPVVAKFEASREKSSHKSPTSSRVLGAVFSPEMNST